MTFGSRSRSGKTSSHTAMIEASSCIISEEAGECRLSKNLRQRQQKIEQQALQISSLEAQNKKIGAATGAQVLGGNYHQGSSH